MLRKSSTNTDVAGVDGPSDTEILRHSIPPDTKILQEDDQWPLMNGKSEDSRMASSSPSTSLLGNRNHEDPRAKQSGQMARKGGQRGWRASSAWSLSGAIAMITLFSVLTISAIVYSFFTRQLAPKGCRMSWMNPSYIREYRFDSEWTRLASKYTLYLYREAHLDADDKVKGVPVLFIPGNAGSYKQVRPIAAEAAQYWHDSVQHNADSLNSGAAPLDIFTVDFNEDLTAFHGQTVLDQAEYLNAAVTFILSLYTDPSRLSRRDGLREPASVIILAHSMGGIVARTMLSVSNYQLDSINTILTMSTPHARPPVSFDGEMVRTYDRINNYWREAYMSTDIMANPLREVSLISIAGGSLDRVVPSDYSSIASLIPATHGFTTYTSTVPDVWTESDHLSILWCDQFRKVVVRSIFDILDGRQKVQTKGLEARMAVFKKHYLTGLEAGAPRSLHSKKASMLLSLGDSTNAVKPVGSTFSLSGFGESDHSAKLQVHLISLNHDHNADQQFHLLTDQRLEYGGQHGELEVLMCSVFAPGKEQNESLFEVNVDISAGSSVSERLACTNVADDVIRLPASMSSSAHPFDDTPSFTHLRYNLSDLKSYDRVVVIDKHKQPTPGWLLANVANVNASIVHPELNLQSLITGTSVMTLPEQRSMATTIRLPSMHSSLLAYTVELHAGSCHSQDLGELFRPFLRQYRSDPFESRYHVNVKTAHLSMHGTAPFMPDALDSSSELAGTSLEIWTDFTCGNQLEVKITLDLFGSMGKLVMRYRTIFAAFPLFILAIVMWKQFLVFDETGVFITFSEALNACLGFSIPFAVAALTMLALLFANPTTGSPPTIGAVRHDRILGSSDSFFWFLVPLFSILAVGVCVVINYAGLVLTHLISTFMSLFSRLSSTWRGADVKETPNASRSTSSTRRRILTMIVLFALVAFFLPYQFAYVVACLVQLANAARALPSETTSSSSSGDRNSSPSSSSAYMTNYSNYAHSILMLMIWILPINAPVLVVWIHNLTVHYFSPFSSHHNILSIMPIILLVETLTGGRMIPRLRGRERYITSGMLLFISGYAAVYGVSFAFQLHHLVNLFAAWLVAVYFYAGGLSLEGIGEMLDDSVADDANSVKQKH